MSDEASQPEFGPGGYLPPRAAKRARKIVLREQMGTGWPLAAVLAAVLVAVAGGAYLYTSTRAPAAPFVAMGPLTQVEPGSAASVTSDAAGGVEALVVRAGGTVRAFRAEPGDIAWCPESGRIENAQAAWTPEGRAVHGEAQSLRPLRSVVYDGVVYVDTTTSLPRPPAAPGGAPPVCGAGAG